MLLREGEVVRGNFVVDRFLGEGAFAEVYRVKHRLLGLQAMKVFKAHGTFEEIKLALEEANVLSKLGHRNIIRVFEADIIETSAGSRGFFTMEYLPEGNLHQYWQSHGKQFVPVDVAVNIARQVCQGLSLAHADNPPIVHRDIKPENILMGYDAAGLRACVSDFGLAKRANPLLIGMSARGTRWFKAPETFNNPMSDSCAGDVWAVGVTLYILLTDKYPYTVGEDGTPDVKSFDLPLVSASQRNIRVDPEIDKVLLRALSVNRGNRYQNAEELLRGLNGWSPPSDEPDVKRDGFEAKEDRGKSSPLGEDAANELVAQALQLAQEGSRLGEAADLMEEAFTAWPPLREKYEHKAKLWRKGIAM